MVEEKQQRKSFPLRLEKDLMEKLKKLADVNRRPITTEIIIAIERYVEEERIEKEKTTAIQKAAQMTLDELCTEKIFVTGSNDEETLYKYINFPGVYEVSTNIPDSPEEKKSYRVVTKEEYKKIIKE